MDTTNSLLIDINREVLLSDKPKDGTVSWYYFIRRLSGAQIPDRFLL
jgi:hypothetical protein